MSRPAVPLPQAGNSKEDVLDQMKQARESDVKWQDGNALCLVFDAGTEIQSFLKEAYTMFFCENALNPTAFPSLRKFETEVVSMAASLLGGDDQVSGNMTSGGTESILMAMKVAKEWGKKKRRIFLRPEVIAPITVHPAFEKAADYFGMKVVHIPVDKHYRVDLQKVKKAINRRTVMLVGSAPQYCQGIIDPIEELGRIALKNDLLLHVDACVGGFMLPFVKSLGYSIPNFDFSVPGVTSISADLHKYGYAAKGASLVLFKTPELRRHMFFAYTDWPGGIYISPTMAGTRPGGAIAAAWAIMKHLGYDGYRSIAQEVMDITTYLKNEIEKIDGVYYLGDPKMSLMALASDDVDIYEVGDHMTAAGWQMDRHQQPASLHLTITRGHIAHADRFLNDLRTAIEASRKPAGQRMLQSVAYKTISGVTKILPPPVTSKLTTMASSLVGGEGGELPGNTAVMYGLMGTLPNRGDIKELVLDLMDNMSRATPNDPS